jgi:hypothetical protein
MNFDLLNTSCQKAILISEDYCLDKSFDIIIQNFNVFSNDLAMTNDQFDRFQILKDKYEKNKDKYRKFLTFVSQFSSSLENVQQVHSQYKNIWSVISTPMEIFYPEILSIEKWGSFNIKTGEITEVNSVETAKTINNIETWVNSKFPENEYGIYKNISVRIYFYIEIPVKYKMNATYNEKCIVGGKSTKVCCKPCGFGGFAPCNRMGGKNDHVCGNMFSRCPGAYYNSSNCATGSCSGWKSETDPKLWKGQDLKISREIIFNNDKFFIGYSKINLSINSNNSWKRV